MSSVVSPSWRTKPLLSSSTVSKNLSTSPFLSVKFKRNPLISFLVISPSRSWPRSLYTIVFNLSLVYPLLHCGKVFVKIIVTENAITYFIYCISFSSSISISKLVNSSISRKNWLNVITRSVGSSSGMSTPTLPRFSMTISSKEYLNIYNNEK